MQTERVQRRVEFRDTDAAGLAHFSTYFVFMEEAEHEFLRRRGLSVYMHDADGPLSWPRVATKCDYASPLRFEDEFTIDVGIGRLGEKSVTYTFTFLCGERSVARGEMTSVCCRLAHDAPPKAIAIPAWIRERLDSPSSSPRG
jgi:acyl-CoA thioester hydrolase